MKTIHDHFHNILYPARVDLQVTGCQKRKRGQYQHHEKSVENDGHVNANVFQPRSMEEY
jgi:hypothetical protein